MPDCPPGLPGPLCTAAGAVLHPVDTAKAAVSSAASGAASSAFEGMVNSLKEGVGKAVGLMMSFWMKIPIPSIGAPGNAVDRLHQATLYLTVLTAVVSIFFVAGRAALAHRAAASEEAQEAAKGLVRIVVASSVAIPAVVLASQACDEYSTWLVNQAANGDVGAAVLKLMAFDRITGTGFTFIMALIALLASVVQAFLIVIRDALLILLVGTLPLAAAASISSSGRQTWHKMVGWLIAFLLFKPVAAMCYAGALWSVTNASNEIDQIAGIFLVILAVLTLPALMRLITPQVEKVGGGGGGAMLGAAGAAATGAVSMAGASRGSSSGARSGGGGGGGGDKAAFLGPQGSARPAAAAAKAGGPSGASPTTGAGGAPGSKGSSPTGSAGAGAGGAAGKAGGAGRAAAGGPYAAAAGVQAASGAQKAVSNAANGAADGDNNR